MSNAPKIFSLPMERAGTHETFVLVIDGVPQSVNSWNYTENEHGDRTFYLEGITEWQLTFKKGSTIQVIR